MYKEKNSILIRVIVLLLAVLMAIIGYCVYDLINKEFFAGVYPLGKLVALTAGFIPIMVADVIRTKKITSLILPFICFLLVFIWFYFTLPEMSYDKATDSLGVSYDSVQTAVLVFDEEEIVEEKIPGYYKGAYIFEATKDSIDYYVIMNPKDGETYEYEAEKNEHMARYFEKE